MITGADQKKAIAGIKEGKHGIEISFHSKSQALEQLGRHLGLFKDKIEVSGALNTAQNGLDNILKQLRGDVDD